MTIDHKQQLIKSIEEVGFPLGFVRGEADSYYGFYVKSKDEVYALGYAADELGDDILSLNNLDIVDLASLLKYGKDCFADAKECYEEEHRGGENGEN